MCVADIQHENTEEIVCPWCGHQYQDSWEFSDDDETDCDECEKQFTFHRIIDVTYDTEKVEPNE